MRKFYDHPSPNPKRVLFLEVAVAHDDTLDAPLGNRRYVLGDTAIWAPEVSFILGDDALSTLPHVTRAPDGSGALPAAICDNALKERRTLRAQPDEAVRGKRLARKPTPHAT